MFAPVPREVSPLDLHLGLESPPEHFHVHWQSLALERQLVFGEMGLSIPT